jgi:hypothetical protein
MAARGHGPGNFSKTQCDSITLGSPTWGWGAGRPWRMIRTAVVGSDRIEGWGGGSQWKLFCEAPN